MPQPKFIKKPLNEITPEEWESLCDGCGLCCQHRLQDEDTDEIALSNIACNFLCLKTNKCSDYENRLINQPLCAKITPTNIGKLDWLPVTCAYRLVYQGRRLPPWHYLVCGDKKKVHTRGPSMLGGLIHESESEIFDE